MSSNPPKTTKYLMVRNWLNILFIAFSIAFITIFFLVQDPWSNLYYILSGILAVLLKMGETIIRVIENLQQNKLQKRSSTKDGSE